MLLSQKKTINLNILLDRDQNNRKLSEKLKIVLKERQFIMSKFLFDVFHAKFIWWIFFSFFF